MPSVLLLIRRRHGRRLGGMIEWALATAAPIAVAVISVAPSLLEAAPEVLSYTGAAVMLLVVWALWPMLGGWGAAQRNSA